MSKLTGDMILSWVRRNLTDYKIRKGGQEIVLPNPWGDSGHHFNIGLIAKKSKRSDRKGFWVHDWRPGYRQHDGSFLKFVQDFRGCTFFDAVKDVCGAGTDPRSWLRNARKGQEKAEEIPEETELKLPAGAKRIDIVADTLAYKFACNYLKSRSIDMDEAKQYYVHYDSVSIIFPYIEFGMVVYWQSRTTAGKTFDFPPDSVGVTKSEFLYGFDYVEPGSTIVVCESIIDAINIGPGAVAMGGADLSEKQVRKIRILNPSNIILAADNDKPDKHGGKAAGVSSIIKNHKLLRPYYNEIYYSIPSDPHKDWNDVRNAGLDARHAVEANKKLATLKSLMSLRNVI